MLLTPFPWAFVPLKTLLQAKQDDLCKQNLEASSYLCSALLQDIFGRLEEDVKQGMYSKPGGHRLFIQKVEELKAKYYQEPGKGIQAEEALQKYFQSKESVSDAILQTDLALTQREKEMEEARKRAEAAKAKARMLENIQRQNQLRLEQRERLHQEQVRQMEVNRANYVAEQQRALERRLQEEAAKQKERIEAERRRLQNEIEKQRTAAPPEDPCVLL